MQVWVETYAGHGGLEMPRRFRLGEREIDVIENLDQWCGVQCRYFKVRGDDESLHNTAFRRDSGSLGAGHASTPANLSGSSELPYSGKPGRWSGTTMRFAEQG